VNRLVQLTGFEQITAPFDGVITSRFIDVGSLVTADVAAMSRLMLKSAKRASLVENLRSLRGLDKVRVR
jgi:multidrug efflux pump subunit AcrA (membrane-fusion protein)